MPNKILLLSLALIVLYGASSAQRNSKNVNEMTITSPASIRERPSDTGKVLVQVKPGDLVYLESLEMANGWFFVSYNQQKGWMLPGHWDNVGRLVWPEWIYVASSKTGRLYYNGANVKRENNLALVSATIKDSEGKKTIFSGRYEINCYTSEFRVTEILNYSSGKEVKEQPSEVNKSFRVATNGTTTGSLVMKVCEKEKL